MKLPRTIDVGIPGVSVTVLHRHQDAGIDIAATFSYHARTGISEAEVMRTAEIGEGALLDVIGREARETVARLLAGAKEHIEALHPPRGSDVRSSPDGSVTVTVPCDETSGELP